MIGGIGIGKIKSAEFYDIAAKRGFYGLETGGLTGKMDNVRKYWEDVVIKLTIRNSVEKVLARKSEIRIIDFGCGSGEGFELLTHIPVSQPYGPENRSFILSPDMILSYIGVDISAHMIQQGRHNYQNRNNIRFELADLNKGFPLKNEEPFDIYFSSYSSLSHLPPENLETLVAGMLNNAEPGSFIVFDLLGKCSLEWPKYWNECRIMLPYNMAYLLPPESRDTECIHLDVCFWVPCKLFDILDSAAKKAEKSFQIVQSIDRSLFVGRHMETGLFGAPCFNYRYQVNRLFDQDHREEIENLLIDLGWCSRLEKIQPEIFARLNDYKEKWNCVIHLVKALLQGDNSMVSHLIETTPADISNELKFLAWLYRNAHRFPVVDFWASIMGPQIAVILRNIEMSLGPALGCGHGLFCVVEIG